MVLNLIYKSKSTNQKKSKRENTKLSFFFVAFVERGRKKKYIKIHFTNKEEDSGILPKKGNFRAANNAVKSK